MTLSILYLSWSCAISVLAEIRCIAAEVEKTANDRIHYQPPMPGTHLPRSSCHLLQCGAQPTVPQVILEEQELWQEFYNVGTEMILTKSGRFEAAVRVNRRKFKTQVYNLIAGECFRDVGSDWLDWNPTPSIVSLWPPREWTTTDTDFRLVNAYMDPQSTDCRTYITKWTHPLYVSWRRTDAGSQPGREKWNFRRAISYTKALLQLGQIGWNRPYLSIKWSSRIRTPAPITSTEKYNCTPITPSIFW